ncbi:MAG: GNAT family N-acetyltransferase [Gemmatimonadetes bacterium]|nr:GNAT family N-acetyltransferase [Gemmatimonadota bacterium]
MATVHTPGTAELHPRPSLVAEPAITIRRAQLVDVLQLAALVNGYAAQRLLLPRTTEQVALALDNYVVAVDAGGRVLACAALEEYSPSVAEIASVAVDRAFQGHGLGSQVVAAAEQVARQRGFVQVFAMSLAERFFRALGYDTIPIEAYPEKMARYERLVAEGVDIVPKDCFAKSIA